MFRHTAQTTVNKSPAEVTAFLANASNEKAWQNGIVHLELVSGEPGTAGAKWDRVQELGGRKIKTTHTLAEVKEGQRVAYESEGKIVKLRFSYDVKPGDGGASVEGQIEGELLGFAAMFESMASEALQEHWPTALNRLGDHLASQKVA